jgi:hypothetical protein
MQIAVFVSSSCSRKVMPDGKHCLLCSVNRYLEFTPIPPQGMAFGKMHLSIAADDLPVSA